MLLAYIYGVLHQAALKEDLADAMATCEELDQTVTDLTNELHAKVTHTAYTARIYGSVAATVSLYIGQWMRGCEDVLVL